MTTRATRERRLVVALSGALVVLVGAIAAVVLAERRAAAGAAIATAVSGTVSRLSIERPGRGALVLERRGGSGGDGSPASSPEGESTVDDAGERIAESGNGDWRIVTPCEIDANDARVQPLLDALAGARLEYPAGEVDLDAAGLDDPLAVVRLDDTAIGLGATDLGGERRYALVGERVALVPEWTLSLAEGGLSALAEPALFGTAPTRVRRLDDTATELDPAPWADLAASQVVAWPVTNAPVTTRRARLEATFASGGTRVVELLGNADWNAVPSEDERCARLFAEADLPPGTYP